MELNAGTIDCIWNGFTMTGREEDYTWSDPYMNNRQVVVVRSDSDIASFDDLAGKIVEVQTDSSAEAALAEMPELTGTFSMLQTTPDYNAAFMDLEMGAVDAIAIDVVVASYQIHKSRIVIRRGDVYKRQCPQIRHILSQLLQSSLIFLPSLSPPYPFPYCTQDVFSSTYSLTSGPGSRSRIFWGLRPVLTYLVVSERV